MKLTEGGSFLASAGGGAAGAYLGTLAAAPVCIAIGVGTFGIGGLVCGVVVVGAGAAIGGNAGAGIGGELGEVVYEGVK